MNLTRKAGYTLAGALLALNLGACTYQHQPLDGVREGNNPTIRYLLQECINTDGVPVVVTDGGNADGVWVYCIHKQGR